MKRQGSVPGCSNYKYEIVGVRGLYTVHVTQAGRDFSSSLPSVGTVREAEGLVRSLRCKTPR